MIMGIIGLAFVGISLYILDPFVVLGYNAIDAAQGLTNGGAIKLVLGLTGFILVISYVLGWMRSLNNPNDPGVL